MARSRFAVVVAAVVFASVSCGSDSISAPSRFDIQSTLPSGWVRVGGQLPATYVVGIDNATTHGGHSATAMAGTDSVSAFFTGIGQVVKADQYRGKRVRFRAWVKTEGIAGSGPAGLWMRVDGQELELAFDNSASHTLRGSTDWRQVEVILDVAQNAVGIAFGALIHGSGVLVVDDMTFEVIPATGPTSDQLSGPVPVPGFDAITSYTNAPTAPFNLDFESK
jgi:hypothetical protein